LPQLLCIWLAMTVVSAIALLVAERAHARRPVAVPWGAVEEYRGA
jgi:hypothetical protein